jgi:hypothetical protein
MDRLKFISSLVITLVKVIIKKIRWNNIGFVDDIYYLSANSIIHCLFSVDFYPPEKMYDVWSPVERERERERENIYMPPLLLEFFIVLPDGETKTYTYSRKSYDNTLLSCNLTIINVLEYIMRWETRKLEFKKSQLKCLFDTE